MKIGTLGFVIFVGVLMLLTTVAVADFVGTRVFFIIRRTIGFMVTLPSTPGLNYTAGNTTAAVITADVEFNASNKSQYGINASVAPCCANIQTGVIPIFNYTNTGTIPINITLAFNGTTMPPGVNVTASNGTLAYMTGDCTLGTGVGLTAAPDGDPGTTCKNVTNTFSTFIANLQPGRGMNLFLWATYDNFPATGGSINTAAYTRNLTHASQATDGG